MLIKPSIRGIDMPGIRFTDTHNQTLKVIGALIYLLVVCSILWTLFPACTYDDPFITYRYAENLVHDRGLVYNPGERVLSTTTPLFALLLGGLAHLWPALPRLANAIGVVSIAVGALFLWDIAASWKTPLVGWGALVLYPTFPLLLITLGSETPLYLACGLGAFSFYIRRRYVWTALAVAAMVLTRPDGVLVAVVLSLDFLLRRRESIPWLALGLCLGLIGAWSIFAWSYYGSPLPATLVAKQQQGAMAVSTRFAPGLLTVMGWYSNWRYGIELGLSVVGVLGLLSRKKWILFLIWPSLYFIAYAFLGVSSYFWYYTPLVPGFLVLVGLGATTCCDWIWQGAGSFLLKSNYVFTFRRLAWLPAAVIITALFLFQLPSVQQASTNPDPRYSIYRAAGEWLANNIPPNFSVGTLEVGIIGYYARKPMVDFAGLIQPAVASRLSQSKTYEDVAEWAVEHYQPNYLVLQKGYWVHLEREYVSQHCTLAHEFGGNDYKAEFNLSLYACQWSADNKRLEEP